MRTRRSDLRQEEWDLLRQMLDVTSRIMSLACSSRWSQIIFFTSRIYVCVCVCVRIRVRACVSRGWRGHPQRPSVDPARWTSPPVSGLQGFLHPLSGSHGCRYVVSAALTKLLAQDTHILAWCYDLLICSQQLENLQRRQIPWLIIWGWWCQCPGQLQTKLLFFLPLCIDASCMFK